MSGIQEIMNEIIARAEKEPEFRARLVQSPIATLQDEGHTFSEDGLNIFLGRVPDDSTAGRAPGGHGHDDKARALEERLRGYLNSRMSPKCVRAVSD
jgi:hypothetical protein